MAGTLGKEGTKKNKVLSMRDDCEKGKTGGEGITLSNN